MLRQTESWTKEKKYFREEFRDLLQTGVEHEERTEENSACSAARRQLYARNQGPPTLLFRGTQNWRAKMWYKAFRVGHQERHSRETTQKKAQLLHILGQSSTCISSFSGQHHFICMFIWPMKNRFLLYISWDTEFLFIFWFLEFLSGGTLTVRGHLRKLVLGMHLLFCLGVPCIKLHPITHHNPSMQSALAHFRCKTFHCADF